MPALIVRRCLLAAALLILAAPAAALTFVFETPISGDDIPVTVVLADAADAAEGDAVDVTVSIPPGSGDLLGLFGNVVDESLVPELVVADPTGMVTQWQFSANRVWKVGGGNTLAPVKAWDWGVKLGQTGAADGGVETASFRLTAPSLDVAQLTGAANQGWVLGVRVQGTGGAEGSAKLGLLEGQPPEIEPPTLSITSPEDGALVAASPVAVTGSV